MMNLVLEIVRDETALTSKAFEDRCRRLSKFCQFHFSNVIGSRQSRFPISRGGPRTFFGQIIAEIDILLLLREGEAHRIPLRSPLITKVN